MVIVVSTWNHRFGGVAAAQKSCRDWIKQTIVFIVDSLYCFVYIVSRSIVSIQLG